MAIFKKCYSITVLIQTQSTVYISLPLIVNKSVLNFTQVCQLHCKSRLHEIGGNGDIKTPFLSNIKLVWKYLNAHSVGEQYYSPQFLLLTYSQKVRLGWKCVAATNTRTNASKILFTLVKSFTVQASVEQPREK